MGAALNIVQPASMQKVLEVSGSGSTNWDIFTGKAYDINSVYKFTLELVSAGASNLSCFFNADYTAVNYYEQSLSASNGVVSAGRGTGTQFASISGTELNETITGTISFPGGKPCFVIDPFASDEAASIAMYFMAIKKVATIASWSSFRITGTANILASSKFKLYKLI